MTMSGAGNGFSGTQLDYTPTSGGSVDLTGGGNNTQILVSFGLVDQVPAPGQLATGVTVFMSATDSSGATAIEPSDAVGNYFAFNAAFPFTGTSGFQCQNTTCTQNGHLDFSHITHFSITFEYPSSGSGGGSLTVQVNELWATPTGGAPPSAPSPTVTAPATAAAPAGGAVNFTVSFSDDQGAAPVTYNPPSNTGLRAQDITLGGTAFGTGATPTAMVTGGPSDYTVAVSGMTQDGSITLHVPAGVVDDAWGQQNTASANDPTTAFTFAIPPAFTSVDQASLVETTSGSYTVTTTGNPAATLSISQGSLPSGLAFSDNGDGTATISGSPDLNQVGTHSLTLKASNVGGSVTQAFTLTIAKADQAALTVTSTGGTFGSPLALTTTGGSGTGAVSYTVSDGTASGCAISSGTLTATSAGTCRVTATKAADSNYNPVSSPQTTVTLGKASQSITFTSEAPAGRIGETYTVVALASSGLPVTFSIDAGSGSGVCSLSGATVTFAAPGSCIIDGHQSGNGSYLPAGQSQQSLTVAPSSPSSSAGSGGAVPSNHFITRSRYKPRRNGFFTVTVKVPGPGTVNVMVTAWKTSLVHAARATRLLQPAIGRFVFARARARARRAGTLRIIVRPNARGRRLLARHKPRSRVRLWVTFIPVHGRPRSVGYYGILLP